MFGIYRMSRGTNAPYIFTGIIVIYFVWVVVRALNMELLQAILGQLVSVGVIALIILFQPEIRTFLQAIGRRQGPFRFINNFFNNRGSAELSLQPIITACSEMSVTKTGALIVIAQRSDLADIVDSGITSTAMRGFSCCWYAKSTSAPAIRSAILSGCAGFTFSNILIILQ